MEMGKEMADIIKGRLLKPNGWQDADEHEYVRATDYEALRQRFEKACGEVTRLSAAPEALCIPEGWRLVPVRPTIDMIEAGADSPGMKVVNGIVGTHCMRYGNVPLKELHCDDRRDSALGKAYSAMVECAPSPLGKQS